ncbi:MAG TPA: hypothetical protein VKD26_05085 [Streptosporangiaceae bacterium]|nr:hypothetical protein [Streptosporangiaceae bacterium]
MHTRFHEIMTGHARLAEEDSPRPALLDLAADVPGLLLPWTDTEAALAGRVRIEGWADDPGAAGTLRIAPVAARRLRYRLSFTTNDGRRMHLDGWKSVSFTRPLHSLTTLPATILDEKGNVAAETQLRFDLRHALGPMIASVRVRPAARRAAARHAARAAAPRAYLSSRWRGQPGRMEAWYTTFTDPATGTGGWLHHELVAPSGGGTAHVHGWAAVFPPAGAPVLARFGPQPWSAPAGDTVFTADDVLMTPSTLRGSAGTGQAQIRWDLTAAEDGPPLFTFPRWAWEREALPGAQIVPVPAGAFTGTLRHGDREITLTAAPGATGHVYGHGNPERWAWLHAHLGGSDVCEVVAATSTRPGLNRLPPLPFVRLRLGGEDWPPGDPMVHAARFVARIGLPTWTVLGRAGDRRIRIQVTQPADRTVAVGYTDPDGSTAVCRNSERADAVITLQRRTAQGWRAERHWRLDATAHAEAGMRE